MYKLFNKPKQKDYRKILRNRPSLSEVLLWRRLKGQQLGIKFRRQFGIGKYIVDFYCTELKLIIEVDGATHGEEDEIIYDKNRQDYLEKSGFKVLRFTNTEVKENIDEVVENIISACKMSVNPTLSLPFAGEGTMKEV
jgi:very-short-patch-repair endonuclease